MARWIFGVVKQIFGSHHTIENMEPVKEEGGEKERKKGEVFGWQTSDYQLILNINHPCGLEEVLSAWKTKETS